MKLIRLSKNVGMIKLVLEDILIKNKLKSKEYIAHLNFIIYELGAWQTN